MPLSALSEDAGPYDSSSVQADPRVSDQIGQAGKLFLPDGFSHVLEERLCFGSSSKAQTAPVCGSWTS